MAATAVPAQPSFVASMPSAAHMFAVLEGVGEESIAEAKGHLVTIKAELDDAVQQSSMDALQQELHVVESLSSDINVALGQREAGVEALKERLLELQRARVAQQKFRRLAVPAAPLSGSEYIGKIVLAVSIVLFAFLALYF